MDKLILKQLVAAALRIVRCSRIPVRINDPPALVDSGSIVRLKTCRRLVRNTLAQQQPVWLPTEFGKAAEDGVEILRLYAQRKGTGVHALLCCNARGANGGVAGLLLPMAVDSKNGQRRYTSKTDDRSRQRAHAHVKVLV